MNEEKLEKEDVIEQEKSLSENNTNIIDNSKKNAIENEKVPPLENVDYEEKKSLDDIIKEADAESSQVTMNQSEEEEHSEYPYIHNETLSLEDFEAIIKNKDVKKLDEIIENYPISLLAEYLQDMDDTSIVLFFKLSKSEESSQIFSYLDLDQQKKVCEAFSNSEIYELISQMSTDDLVDFVDDLPSNLVKKVLSLCTKEERQKINAFLAFKDDSAGSIMTTEYLSLKEDMSCQDAIKKIRTYGEQAESIQSLYVLDKSRVLVGVVKLDELLFSNDDEKISNIMRTEYAFAYTSTDQEDVLHLFKKYDLTVLPVTNAEKRLLGIITVDDILDVVEDETVEDMNKMSGISSKENRPYFQTTIWKTTLSCFPWLIFLLVIGTLTSLILNSFETQLSAVPILAAFIPSLMDTSGNSGSQTTTVITRSLSLKEIQPKSWYKVLAKETCSGILIGLIIGVFTFVWTLIELTSGILKVNQNIPSHIPLIQFQVFVSLVISLCIFVVILISRIIGAVLPILAKLVHLDPAVMAGPLITTILDTSSLLIYFGLAQAFIVPLLS